MKYILKKALFIICLMIIIILGFFLGYNISNDFAISCGIILSIFCVSDFLLEHFNWFAFEDVIFDLSYIFVLPFMYSNNFLFILVFLLLVSIVLIALYIFFGVKKDYFLRSDCYKEN